MDGLTYLYSLERFGIKLGLEVTQKLLQCLGNPHLQFKSIHVVGTSGKGSTCAYLNSILQEAGYKVGMYTSPHLVRFNERVQIDTQQIIDSELKSLVQEIKTAAVGLEPTFFEFTTCLAFLYFARKNVDIAIIEAGMGARLDATNVIQPEVTVITKIALDHMKYLGNTVQEIAQEKAAAIKKNSPVVTMEKNSELLHYFAERCKEKNCAFSMITPYTIMFSTLQGQEFVYNNENYTLKMRGKHQIENACLALLAVEKLQTKGWNISANSCKKGLAQVSWPGRLDQIAPNMMVDGAHNIEEVETILPVIQELPRDVLLLGIAQDKQIKEMVELLVPLFKKVVVTQGNYKPAPTSVIAKEVRKYVKDVEEIPDVKEALAKIKGRTIFVTGSLYLVGDVMKYLNLFKEPSS